ncbi:hypothetical protein [Mycobacteroides salmoniphilum]|uniref:Uncharacterized protein n=1 Tax=Mycobacteroides salmoniphilum TaxID=404941 RepID=A0A4V3HZD3_9MYCO|nr:hypothetical protein [Mycobacteroides salmoniphilum]MBA0048566.1 hypothetical protein [Mycobacteroides sp. LB1]TDZ93504.1 hypothetical protein CCUG60885_03107 [Mycobacteroides salmoniphilum]TEA09287.1 hypothetical protein CCUG60883_00048 [Mycobacteroides salmoniphilum]
MDAVFEAEAIWRVLPADLRSALHAQSTEPLADELLGKCSAVVEKHGVPVFWRPDPDTFSQYRLHPALVEYLKTAKS